MDVKYPLAIIGGALIGLSSLLLLFSLGRVLGISGICGGVLDRSGHDRGWRIAFILGLISAGIAANYIESPTSQPILQWKQYIYISVAGLLVGFGTRLGNGCTSGHGICGVGRLSPRSIVATIIFFATAAITVWITKR